MAFQPHPYSPRANPGGNYCGHDPKNPRFASVINPYRDEDWSNDKRDSFGHNRKAAWFYAVDAALRQFYFFPKMLPGLGVLEKMDGKKRIRRSEWREDVTRLLSALTHHIELASIEWTTGICRVGMPTEDGFLYFNSKFWMGKTGLSESQLKRAFGKLEASGYITRTRRWVERERGMFKSLATSTVIHLDLYREMGLIEELRDAQAWAYKKLQEAATNLQTSVSRMLRCAVSAVKPKPKAPPASDLGKPEDFPATDPRHWTCRFNKDDQRLDFSRRVAQLACERPTDDMTTLMKDAYLSLKNKRRE